jgi:hypothetical protein
MEFERLAARADSSSGGGSTRPRRGLGRRGGVHKLASVALSTCAVVAFSLSGGVLASGCGSGNTTTGARVTLTTQVTAGDQPGAPFENGVGWTITIDKAWLSVGDLYYFDGAPITAALTAPARTPRTPFEWLAIPSAHAHPGHYVEGNAVGQMLSPQTVDLMAPISELAAAEAVSGTYRSARFSFASPPQGPLAGELDGHVMVVEGTGTKGALTRVFRGALDEGDVLDAAGLPEVEGCIFDEAAVETDGTVRLEVDLALVFDQVGLDELAESTDGDPVDLPRDTPAFNAFSRGAKKGAVFHFSYAP